MEKTSQNKLNFVLLGVVSLISLTDYIYSIGMLKNNSALYVLGIIFAIYLVIIGIVTCYLSQDSSQSNFIGKYIPYVVKGREKNGKFTISFISQMLPFFVVLDSIDDIHPL